MRRLLLLCSLLAAFSAAAQTPDKLPDLQPLPEPPPPPPGVDDAAEPEVTIVERGEDTVEEFRLHGRLYMMRVTPKGGGPSFYLVDQTGDGRFSRMEAHDTGVRPPMWVIKQF